MRRVRNEGGTARRPQWRLASALALLAAALAGPAAAQDFPVSSGQRDTALQVAQRGVPLDELAPHAPATYAVRPGDTLWAISGLFLRRPWRWPELWGMNLDAIRNPHRIYPGQTLYLDKAGGFARLRTTAPGQAGEATGTVRVSPRTRAESLSGDALPTLQPHLIEPFLAEPLVVAEETLLHAPRIVATADERVLVTRGDRAYARGGAANPLRLGDGLPHSLRVFRNAVALTDPASGEILGYEAQYLGRAELVRGESAGPAPAGGDTEIVPATIDIVAAKEEIRAGDRLLPEPAREYRSYTPHAPRQAVDARVVKLYGAEAVAYAAQNQVVAINRGTRDGIENGQVLALLSEGARIIDTTDTDDRRTALKLPNEPNGLAMVFRTFERVSYVLVLDVRTGVKVGDHLANPQ